jgi:hypothetical protein
MIPDRLLRPMRHLTRQQSGVDAYGAPVWIDTVSTIRGRVDQTMRREDRGDGRIAAVGEWLLVSLITVAATDRIEADGNIFEVIGPSWPVYASTAVHHYESTLRLVDG